MNNLFETENFEVQRGSSPFIWTGPAASPIQPQLYLLVNKKTATIEGETRLLAQAIDWCKSMETHLANILGAPSTGLAEAVDSIPDPGPQAFPPSRL